MNCGARVIVTIHVTSHDIARGVLGDPDLCPVALSLRRAISNRWSAAVERHDVILLRHGDDRPLPPLRLPPAAAHFADQFDHGGHDAVGPMRFVIELPEGVVGDGAGRHGG